MHRAGAGATWCEELEAAGTPRSSVDGDAPGEVEGRGSSVVLRHTSSATLPGEALPRSVPADRLPTTAAASTSFEFLGAPTTGHPGAAAAAGAGRACSQTRELPYTTQPRLPRRGGSRARPRRGRDPSAQRWHGEYGSLPGDDAGGTGSWSSVQAAGGLSPGLRPRPAHRPRPLGSHRHAPRGVSSRPRGALGRP